MQTCWTPAAIAEDRWAAAGDSAQAHSKAPNALLDDVDFAHSSSRCGVYVRAEKLGRALAECLRSALDRHETPSRPHGARRAGSYRPRPTPSEARSSRTRAHRTHVAHGTWGIDAAPSWRATPRFNASVCQPEFTQMC